MVHHTPYYEHKKGTYHSPSHTCEDLTILVVREAAMLTKVTRSFGFVENFLDLLQGNLEDATKNWDIDVDFRVELPPMYHPIHRHRHLPILVAKVSGQFDIYYTMETLLGENYAEHFCGVTLPFKVSQYTNIYHNPRTVGEHEPGDTNVVSLVQACWAMDSFLHLCQDKELVGTMVERALRTTTKARIMTTMFPDSTASATETDLVDAITMMSLISGETTVSSHGYVFNPKDTISLGLGHFMDHGTRTINEIRRVYDEIVDGRRYVRFKLGTLQRITEKLSSKTTVRLHLSEVLMPDKLRKKDKGITAEEAATMDAYYRSIGGPVTELYTRIADAVHEDLKELYDGEAEDENPTANDSASAEEAAE